jgi:shikimate kinase
MCAGKSTVAQHLSQSLKRRFVELDELRWDYYSEIDYDKVEASRIAAQEDGARALLEYWKPFEAHAVERVLSEHDGCIIAFGAGHSVYEDEALFARVQHALAPYPWVILLLPSPDLDASVRILNARFEKLLQGEGIEVDPSLLLANETFVRHASNFLLAKMLVFTAGKTPRETADEILQRMAWAEGHS